MNYGTGRCMCHHALRIPFEADDVTDMVGKIFADQGRVPRWCVGTSAQPHRSQGSRTFQGLQIVRVLTRRGWVVLGSDASTFYANYEQGRPFPVLESVSATCWKVSTR